MQSEYKTDRLCYILEETFNYLISILVAGAYLAKLTSTLGISDGLTAILSSFITLGCCAQLLAGVLFRKGKVKKRVIGYFLLNQLLFMLLYLVPFIRIPHGFRAGVFVALLLFGYLSLNVALPARTNWYMSFVDEHKRGVFTAKKEAISLIAGIGFQMGMGAVIDSFEAGGNIRGAFVVSAAVLFLLSVGHTLSLIFTKDRELPANNLSLLSGIRDLAADRTVRPLILLSVFWGITNSAACPFFGTYTIKELGFSMSFLAAMSLVSAVSRVVASIFLGKYADKHSFARMLKLCYYAVAASYAVAAFLRPGNRYVLYPLFVMLQAISMGGINSAEINLVFDYVAPEKCTLALSVRQAVYGVTGFVTAAAAAPLLKMIQRADNCFLGMRVYGQQILSVIALLCTAGTLLYVSRRVIRLPGIVKEVKRELECH